MTIARPEPNSSKRASHGAEQVTRLRLGMPNLDHAGLSTNWLQREACHLHWMALAEQFGTAPSALRDAQGRRMLPSVVASAVTGDPGVICEDDMATLWLEQRPEAGNGWYSCTRLATDKGNEVRVELVTAFAIRTGASNLTLAPADLPAFRRGLRGVPGSARADLLREEGNEARLRTPAEDMPPHTSIRIEPVFHFNGVQLVYFANFAVFFERAERNALPPMPRGFTHCATRTNWFGNLDAGDTLDIVADARANARRLEPEIIVSSHARRRSDKRLIAVRDAVFTR